MSICTVLVGCFSYSPQESILDKDADPLSTIEEIRVFDSVLSSSEAEHPLRRYPDEYSRELWWQLYNEPIMLYIEQDPDVWGDSILVY